ncbi:acetolactate synthase-like protein, partial [Empidonax traillii]|uniref:acetolactate synthase-like protein n=1 Tax=Empidonax traillii TaxID=164674 RepID=UPI000FFD75FB
PGPKPSRFGVPTDPPTPSPSPSSALESLGTPCYLGGAARGLLPPESPLGLRHRRREALRDADLVLLAGAVCDFRLSYGRLFGRGAAVVAVNRHREQLLRNAGVFWSPKLAVQGDPASFVLALARKLQGFSCPREWLEKLREREREKEEENRWQVPVLALVGNDACWTQISREQVALLGSNVGCALAHLDYHGVAEALGGRGVLVARGDSGDGGDGAEAALRAAQELCHRGHPVLVNALIGTTDFRHGSISV